MGVRPRARQMVHAVSDAEILRLLKEGAYKVSLEDGTVIGRRGKPITPWEKNNHLLVRLYDGGKARSVSLGKLVWMAATGEEVPKGFEVHHRNLNSGDNSWVNLIVLHELDHRKFHAEETDELPF